MSPDAPRSQRAAAPHRSAPGGPFAPGRHEGEKNLSKVTRRRSTAPGRRTMRAWRLTAGLCGGIVATSFVLYACGTDESGTCSDTLTCATDDGGSDGSNSDGPATTDGSADATHHDGGLDGGTDSMATGDGDADIADTMVDVWDGYDGFTCDPSQPPSTEPCVIADGYGIFVATGGSASAAGTEAAPVDSITTALTLAQSASKHLIFVCGGEYNGAVSIASTLSIDVKIYGGMSCPTAAGGDGGAAWTYTGAATMVSSGSNHPALTVSGTTHAITIEDVGFVAGDAVNAGDSSIAGWIANASGVTFKRAAFTAGNGVSQPVAGMAPENHFGGALNGSTPLAATPKTGGAEPDCLCGDQTTSFGGQGGGGGMGAGTSGAPGGSNPTATGSPPNDGAAGVGAGMAGALVCGNGHAGANGAQGGAGAGATTLGVLIASSWTPSKGANGASGAPGQGGGGGGGTLGATAVGGGGGACGGCGGGAGQAGAGGGSSFALVVVASTVTLASTTLTAGSGGAGGAGSAGEIGQSGGGGGTVGGGCGGGNGGRRSGRWRRWRRSRRQLRRSRLDRCGHRDLDRRRCGLRRRRDGVLLHSRNPRRWRPTGRWGTRRARRKCWHPRQPRPRRRRRRREAILGSSRRFKTRGPRVCRVGLASFCTLHILCAVDVAHTTQTAPPWKALRDADLQCFPLHVPPSRGSVERRGIRPRRERRHGLRVWPGPSCLLHRRRIDRQRRDIR